MESNAKTKKKEAADFSSWRGDVNCDSKNARKTDYLINATWEYLNNILK